MIPLLLMLAAADAPTKTPVDAERAFAADAKTIGQWTAFRKWSTDDAVMFVPQPANAHDFLKDRKDPANAIDWWPITSWISCDGKIAINKGGWTRPDGSVGYFTTVWQLQADGRWKWVLDHGDTLKVAPERPTEPAIVKASCDAMPVFVEDRLTVLGTKNGHGRSPDGTISWDWAWSKGFRELDAYLFDGKQLPRVVHDEVREPK